MERLAIMQPYFFPYIGYFQLISAVDKFVIYDDVTFIKGGWINRNYIRNRDQDVLVTLPLKNISSNSEIRETYPDPGQIGKWKNKISRTIEQSYRKAPFYENGIHIFTKVLDADLINTSISQINFIAIKIICEYLDIQTTIEPGSTGYNNNHLSGQSRVIDICVQNKAQTYINSIGGKELYESDKFAQNGIELLFLNPSTEYKFNDSENTLPRSSILDIVMNYSKSEIQSMLNAHELITNQ